MQGERQSQLWKDWVLRYSFSVSADMRKLHAIGPSQEIADQGSELNQRVLKYLPSRLQFHYIPGASNFASHRHEQPGSSSAWVRWQGGLCTPMLMPGSWKLCQCCFSQLPRLHTGTTSRWRKTLLGLGSWELYSHCCHCFSPFSPLPS